MNDNEKHMLDNQIEDIKDHEQKLLEKTFEFVKQIASIESQQTSIKEQQCQLKDDIQSLQKNITNEIRISVGGRISDISNLLIQQQEMQNKIINIQGRQGQQIDEIQTTLKEFTKIQEKVSNLEIRVDALEETQRGEQEIQKEKIRGRWAAAGAIAAAIASIIVAILTKIL